MANVLDDLANFLNKVIVLPEVENEVLNAKPWSRSRNKE